MLVYAGIDEAGYGPMLGPLCVACSVFVLPEQNFAKGAPNLWKLLETAVCRRKTDRARRIAVDDSKQLKSSNKSIRVHPLKHLERGVLAFTSLARPCPLSDSELFEFLGVEVPPHDWLRLSTQLPLAHSPEELAIASAKLGRACRTAKVEVGSISCQAIDPKDFNQLVKDAGRKSNVNMTAALRAADSIWRTWPDAHSRIVIDRHGGRIHYREELQLAWPAARIRILDESESYSRYHLRMDGREMTITFAVEGESHHLPVALASMTAKYTRELLMERLNRYFRSHLPELKPTAGYVEDGRRYLRDIAPVLSSLQIDLQSLVRTV